MSQSYLKLVGLCVMMGSLCVASGCTQKRVAAPGGTPPSEALPSPGLGATESLAAQSIERQPASLMLEGRTTGPMRPVYFDFDQSEIREDQKDRMANNATFLKDNPNAVVTIEGNSDERGTNEYNLALGDRRANSAKSYLATLGVEVSKLSTVSYGEERPLNNGHDELAWSQNRRDDFVQWK